MFEPNWAIHTSHAIQVKGLSTCSVMVEPPVLLMLEVIERDLGADCSDCTEVCEMSVDDLNDVDIVKHLNT